MLTLVGTGNQSGKALAEIQRCGFLVVLGQDWRVAHVSANIGDHFADCAPFMPGQPLAEFFGAAAVHAMRNQLALMRSPEATARLYSLFFAAVPKPFDVSMHFHDGRIILEALPASRVEAGDPAGTVRQMADRLDGCETVTDLLQRGAHALRALTGFDSVTLFRLDRNGRAARIAEDARGSAATAVYCPPPETRLLADPAGRTSPLEPEAPRALIARALLRSFTDGESQAAGPQDAAASLSVPLVSAGIPWGVAVCLSRSARHPTLERIAAAELFGDLLAMRAELCELRARTEA
jgi:light-regulated signal transduction histidine kinase (bacteriophytochrome)